MSAEPMVHAGEDVHAGHDPIVVVVMTPSRSRRKRVRVTYVPAELAEETLRAILSGEEGAR
jgi:hypothetical protein